MSTDSILRSGSPGERTPIIRGYSMPTLSVVNEHVDESIPLNESPIFGQTPAQVRSETGLFARIRAGFHQTPASRPPASRQEETSF